MENKKLFHVLTLDTFRSLKEGLNTNVSLGETNLVELRDNKVSDRVKGVLSVLPIFRSATTNEMFFFGDSYKDSKRTLIEYEMEVQHTAYENAMLQTSNILNSNLLVSPINLKFLAKSQLVVIGLYKVNNEVIILFDIIFEDEAIRDNGLCLDIIPNVTVTNIQKLQEQNPNDPILQVIPITK